MCAGRRRSSPASVVPGACTRPLPVSLPTYYLPWTRRAKSVGFPFHPPCQTLCRFDGSKPSVVYTAVDSTDNTAGALSVRVFTALTQFRSCVRGLAVYYSDCRSCELKTLCITLTPDLVSLKLCITLTPDLVS